MSVKTITVTEEAYFALSALKSMHESFSNLFLRLAKEKSITEKYFGVLAGENVEVARRSLKIVRNQLGEDMQRRECALFGHQRGS